MCGIAGILNFHDQPVADADLKKMAVSIAHRGPDDEGFYSHKNLGFAFRRLAVIDLSPAGHQPMSNTDGSVVVVYNGEIYNYRELSVKLQALGYRFVSKSDTEVLLHAYEEYGENCVEYLNGMFAFAIYDKRRRVVLCGRDRLGIKPFYYHTSEKRFIFGSEIKAILQVLRAAPRLDLQSLGEYFTFQNLYGDTTLFDGIRLLMPGQTMTVTEKGGVKYRQYWDPVFRPKTKLRAPNIRHRLKTTFAESVTRHLTADVPVGSQLSGGLDSASIAAVAAQSIPHLMTFTAGFDLTLARGFEQNFDERKDAEVVARHTGSEHYEMVIHAGDMERILPRLIWHLEDLRLGNSYPNFYITRLASKFVKVVLSGTGGDELFAGYPWRYAALARTKTADEFERYHFSYWSRLVPLEHHANFFTRRVAKHIETDGIRESYRRVLRGSDEYDPVTRALYFELKTFLHGLLIIEDKVSSAHGLEVRVPFLDTNLVDYALRIPTSLKLRGTNGKVILRSALKSYLPPTILKKKKQGFAAPEQTWFRKHSLPYIRVLLLSPTSLNREFVQPVFVERLLREHVAGRVNHRLLLWSLLSFEWWLRIFLDRQPIDLPLLSDRHS